MDDDEAALLAELKAISERTSATRFKDNNELAENGDKAGLSGIKSNHNDDTSGEIKEPTFHDDTNWKTQSKQDDVRLETKNRNEKATKNNSSKHVSPQKKSEEIHEKILDGSALSCPNEIVAEEPRGGFKPVVPSTFKGDRGGSAEDADLLAELRAISAKSNSVDRFRGGDEEGEVVESSEGVEVAASEGKNTKTADVPPWKRGKKKAQPKEKDSSEPLPPWKRSTQKESMNKKEETDDVEVEVAAPSLGRKSNETQGENEGEMDVPSPVSEVVAEEPRGGFKPVVPSTFKGDRGGSAEDADLLAELRAISASGSARGRFRDSSQQKPDSSTVQVEEPIVKRREGAGRAGNVGVAVESDAALVIGPFSRNNGNSNSLEEEVTVTPSEVVVTLENVKESSTSKDWKVRKASYEFLVSSLLSIVKEEKPASDVDGDRILSGLDDSIVNFVKDTNAAALDAALIFVLLYADYCRGATSADRCSDITRSLLKGSGLSSSRPSALKNSKSVLLKFMEVCSEGVASVHSIVGVLLTDGLASRKPKIVLNSVSLIVDAARSFGAGSLPLGSLTSGVPKMLSHSNSKVREAGINIVVEICRAAGSKTPLQSVLEKLKPAQMSQIDALLEKQPSSLPPAVGFRQSSHISGPGSAVDVVAALASGAKEEEAKRFASRPAVNLFGVLPSTEYSAKLKLSKWSEKVGALDILIQSGGDKPYKLAQPSSIVNYSLLISDLKKLLGHSHFAVNSKAMLALSMLAEGVGEKLYPHLRPLLSLLMGLSKDKKLTTSVSNCLDSFFGCVLGFDHIMDKDDALPSLVDERKQKNALVRKSSLEYLLRCIKRGKEAGPRGNMSTEMTRQIAHLASESLKDSDAQPRKAALDILQYLVGTDTTASSIRDIIEGLKTDNSRAYKTLSRSLSSPKEITDRDSKRSRQTVGDMGRKASTSRENTVPSKLSSRANPKKTSGNLQQAKPKTASQPAEQDTDGEIPSLEEAVHTLSSLPIPNWDGLEDDEGVLACMKSSAWKSRKNALENLTEFCKSDFLLSCEKVPSSAILSFVKGHTRNFKESNFNVTKAIMELFLAICAAHENAQQFLDLWICEAGVGLAIDKIADKKFALVAAPLLTSLCVVKAPKSITTLAMTMVEGVKSPLPHEALLKWCEGFCVDFGASSLGNGVKAWVPWILKESESANIKVRKAALGLCSELHIQLGPVFKAVLLSDCSSPSLKAQLESTLDSSPFDPDAVGADRAKQSLAFLCEGTGGSSQEKTETMKLEVPKIDLVVSLPKDCVKRMGSKEGKNAWKQRKEAMEEVGAAVSNCSGLLSTTSSSLSALADLIKAVRDRLSDSQSNLKPVAAKLIGSILSSVDDASQARLGRLVFSQLLSAAINDNKRPMRESALASLTSSTERPHLVGGGPNMLSLETLMGAVGAELKDTDLKAIGLPAVLTFLGERANAFPKTGNQTSTKTQGNESSFASSMVLCLTSSKADTRSAAEIVLKSCVEAGALNPDSIEEALKQLVPAQQRAIQPLIQAFVSNSGKLTSDGPTSSKTQVVRNARSSGKVPTRAASENALGKQSPRRIARKGAQRPANVSADDSTSSNATKPSPPTDLQTHPLRSSSVATSTKESRLTRRRDNWPEFPEDPSDIRQITSLRKVWSSLLPAESSEVLFPRNGFQKQEDAVDGCALLTKAIELSRNDDDDDTILDQLDLINKWLSCALCSREHTVGMNALFAVIHKLFLFLEGKEYLMTDSEAGFLLPFLLEKTSAVKGRFQKMGQNLLLFLSQGRVYPAQKYGSLVCISVVERTALAKARALAMRECLICLSSCGLSAVGKKGIQITAKSFSEESVSENKSAFLDLVDGVLSKMNGDIQKYFRICGPTNLTDKAKSLIEERWAKQAKAASTDVPTERKAEKLKKKSTIPPSNRGQTRKQFGAASSSNVLLSTEARKSKKTDGVLGPIRQEVPALNLRIGDFSSEKTESIDTMTLPVDGPFTFTYESNNRNGTDSDRPAFPKTNSLPVFSTQPKISVIGESVTGLQFGNGGLSPSTEFPTTEERRGAMSAPAASGTAASLRARLNQIRDKHRVKLPKQSEFGIANPQPTERGLQKLGLGDATQRQETSLHLANDNIARKNDHSGYFDELLESFRQLISEPKPIDDANIVLSEGMDGLRRMHAALTNSSVPIDDLSVEDLRQLKYGVVSNTSLFVESLTSVLEFGFQCFHPLNSAGLSVPLLSVTLAALMAVFRDQKLASSVSQRALACLLKQAATSLLDSRLTVSSSSNLVLKDSTCVQLVRAINKLAIQAAIGTKRHVSLQALMRLQVQFCNDSATEEVENSNLSARLSRVATKLFARVMKAEEGLSTPFEDGVFDLLSLLPTFEDMLQSCRGDGTRGEIGDDKMAACLNMGKVLMIALIKSRTAEDGTSSLRSFLRIHGFGNDSCLRKLLTSSESELSPGISPDVSLPKTSIGLVGENHLKGADSDSLARLVSNVGKASEGVERVDAINALRSFMSSHPNVDIQSNLAPLSAPFRAYILDQLQGSSRESNSLHTTNNMATFVSSSARQTVLNQISYEDSSPDAMRAMPMSERIRYLKSKLNATEAVVQSAVDSGSEHTRQPFGSADNWKIEPVRPFTGERRTSDHPDKLSSIRERIAATQGKSVGSKGGYYGASSSLGSAAALRARLEAAKKNKQYGN